MVGEVAREGFCERLKGFCVIRVSIKWPNICFNKLVVLFTPCRWRNVAVIDGYDIAAGLKNGSGKL